MLQKLDFSTNEALVYDSLLGRGESTADPIIKETGLHRNIVYTSLDHLMDRKLVSAKKIGGKTHFFANSPDVLVQEYESKSNFAKEVADLVEQKINRGQQEITIYEGNDEYLKLLTGIIGSMPKGSSKYVFGTGGEDFMKATMRPIWNKYHKVAKEQNINIKMVSFESQRESIASDIAPEKIYEVKYLPDWVENPAGIHIYPSVGIVLNIIYSDDVQSVTAIKIKDQKLTEGYMNLFNNLWKQGKQ